MYIIVIRTLEDIIMTKKKLQPIEITDLLDYRFPGNLQYSPDGK